MYIGNKTVSKNIDQYCKFLMRTKQLQYEIFNNCGFNNFYIIFSLNQRLGIHVSSLMVVCPSPTQHPDLTVPPLHENHPAKA